MRVRLTGLVALLVLILAPAAMAVSPAPNPQSGSVGLSGKVPGPPPAQAATIDLPINGATITSLPVQVSGRCQSDLLIKIFKNEVFAGSTICGSDGSYSLKIDLFTGANNLVARIYDDADQSGPDSNTVKVTYTPNATEGGVLNAGNQQLLLRSDYARLGVAPGDKAEWPVDISGGRAPYAISWDWGDGTVDPIVRQDQGLFKASHTYAKAGLYQVTILATDKDGRRAYLQVVTIVNGGLGVPGTSRKIFNEAVSGWVLYLMIGLIFLLGFIFGWWRRSRRDRGPAYPAATPEKLPPENALAGSGSLPEQPSGFQQPTVPAPNEPSPGGDQEPPQSPAPTL